jgi:hypothetical protein
MKSRNLISEIVSILFILLWVYAAASKLIDFQKFSVQLSKSPMLTPFATVAVWFIPFLEILIAILLVPERSRKVGLYASFSLITMFSVYILILTKLSDNVPCSCGGILEKLSWNDHLVFNLFFIVSGIAAILLREKNNAITVINT